MPSSGTNDAMDAPEGGGELDSMRVKYGEPLAAWTFVGKVAMGHMWYIGGRMCFYAFRLFTKKSRGRWKRQSRDMERTTNSTSRVHNDQHNAASTPHSKRYSEESPSLQYFSAFGRMRFTHGAVVSKA